MIGVRRSGRIPKEIPIVLLGTDTSGRVFSEETRTLVLSRHGAGILSRNKFAPDEVLTMRIAGTARETEIRLVGHLGEDPCGNVYGVAFSDPELNFWQMDFPAPPQQHLAPHSVALECCYCSSRSLVQQNEIEADVFLASNSLFRFCESCGQTTPWKPATGEVSKSPAMPAAVQRPMVTPPTPPDFLVNSPSAYSSSFVHAEFESAPAVPIASSSPSSAYSAAAVLHEVVVSGFAPPPQSALSSASDPGQSVPARALSSAEPPAFAGGGKKNRRRHVRTRVNFTACIRLDPAAEEIVECDNISKGGLCFRSRKRYEQNAVFQVAVPFSPGQPAIFVKAQIRRAEALPGCDLFRYGVAYI
ncbi:MAG: PilZ domain-containing protein [Acidobacteria bacterium]|nr:PilZ domain-containing protein [Acidobacteriota bacterium]MBS1866388.1 PilZ domain-containing protein [Acidobacteriota bacterium]